jgi:hypothetical protein
MKKILLGLVIIVTLASCSKEAPQTNEEVNIKRSTSIQCRGLTQASIRCKNMTLNANGRCYLHGGN